MNFFAHAVPDKFPYDAVSVGLSSSLDRPRDVHDLVASLRLAKPVVQGLLGHFHQ